MALCRRRARARVQHLHFGLHPVAELGSREVLDREVDRDEVPALAAGLAQRSESPAPVRQALGTIERLAGEALNEIRGFMDSLDTRDADWAS